MIFFSTAHKNHHHSHDSSHQNPEKKSIWYESLKLHIFKLYQAESRRFSFLKMFQYAPVFAKVYVQLRYMKAVAFPSYLHPSLGSSSVFMITANINSEIWTASSVVLTGFRKSPAYRNRIPYRNVPEEISTTTLETSWDSYVSAKDRAVSNGHQFNRCFLIYCSHISFLVLFCFLKLASIGNAIIA